MLCKEGVVFCKNLEYTVDNICLNSFTNHKTKPIKVLETFGSTFFDDKTLVVFFQLQTKQERKSTFLIDRESSTPKERTS